MGIMTSKDADALRSWGTEDPYDPTASYAHEGERLDAMRSNAERARYCEAKVRKYRNLYYAGQNSFVEHFRSHPDATTAGQPDSAITAIAQKRWSNDARAKDYVGLEQMWSRWLLNYAALAQLEVLQNLATTVYGASRSASPLRQRYGQ